MNPSLPPLQLAAPNQEPLWCQLVTWQSWGGGGRLHPHPLYRPIRAIFNRSDIFPRCCRIFDPYLLSLLLLYFRLHFSRSRMPLLRCYFSKETALISPYLAAILPYFSEDKSQQMSIVIISLSVIFFSLSLLLLFLHSSILPFFHTHTHTHTHFPFVCILRRQYQQQQQQH